LEDQEIFYKRSKQTTANKNKSLKDITNQEFPDNQTIDNLNGNVGDDQHEFESNDLANRDILGPISQPKSSHKKNKYSHD
jgi:hypothetical protein